MNLVICGSRSITDYNTIKAVIDTFFSKLPVACDIIVKTGGARGVDTIAQTILTNEFSLRMITVLTPDYRRYGKGAPLVRNKELADWCDEVLAIWDGKSKGTKHMIDESIKRGKKATVKVV